jgi:hypothetical protein
MERTDLTAWRHWADAWLSGLPRGSAKERAAEDRLAALIQQLGLDRDEGDRPLGPTRCVSFGFSTEADIGLPAAFAG